MVNKNCWLGILAMVFGLILAGCGTTSYNVQTFSNNVETLSSSHKDTFTIICRGYGARTSEDFYYLNGKRIKNIETLSINSALIMAQTYEDAMIAAKNIGLTKVLSIEYGTTTLFGAYWGFVWVRCIKE